LIFAVEGVVSMTDRVKPMASQRVILKEEFDDWGTLVDSESGTSFAINPISVFIWKRLDGKNSIEDIIGEIRSSYGNVPADAGERLKAFIKSLEDKGFVDVGLERV
jgi:SynChlorMet cassette protein ScmD